MRKPNSLIPACAGITILLFALTVYADSPPPKKKNKLKWLQDLSSGADLNSHKSATVAGVRGLEEVGAPPDTSVRDFKAVDRLDAVTIKDDEIKAFLSQGKLR